ncbi:histidine kinase [Runella sp. MFBS21]|uniref:sensor histidine kinase n=1 Tax=Runella sp. MFBS21 TaxID=3034018 RepID=UPI0023F7E248|nr:ATP-binding protein [Runella sp. MFBS21]MDF7820924.1 histidine kinase [Runella sp. MFBS21]
MGEFYYLFSSSLFKGYFIKNGYLLAQHFFNESYIFMIAFHENIKASYPLFPKHFLLFSRYSLKPLSATFLKSLSLFLVSYPLLNVRLKKYNFLSIPLSFYTLSITPTLVFYVINLVFINTKLVNIEFLPSPLSFTVLVTIMMMAISSIITQNWIYIKTRDILLKTPNLILKTNLNKSNKDESSNIYNQLQIQRERLARDLHDGIGSQLTHIITKLDILAIKSSDSKQLEMLSDFARETNQILRETVWVLNQKSIEYSLLQKRISSFLNKLWQEREQPELQISMYTGSSLLISPIIAINIFRICQEVVNNALKYSNANCIEINFHQKPNKVRIEIKDNGQGFELTKIQKGYGLDNIRKRCDELGGQLFLVSNSTGTAILFELPPVELETYLSGNKND